MKNEYIVKYGDQSISFKKGKYNLLSGPIGSGKSKFLKSLVKEESFPQGKVFYLDDKESYPQEKIIESLLKNLEHQEDILYVLKMFGITEISVFFNYKQSIGIYQLLNFLYMYILSLIHI